MKPPSNDPGSDNDLIRRFYIEEMERARSDRFVGILIMSLCVIVAAALIATIILS
jgi:hypothetical protein